MRPDETGRKETLSSYLQASDGLLQMFYFGLERLFVAFDVFVDHGVIFDQLCT